MKPAIVFPLVVTDSTLLDHLHVILPDLKEHFEHAYISTLKPADLWLVDDDFFIIVPMKDMTMPVGEQFKLLYQEAARAAHSDQILHFCFVDRLAFALQEYRKVFLTDIDSLSKGDTPLLFQRSQLAWETHPQNYRQIEGIATIIGFNLIDQELDYAWCHLAVCAGRLREILPWVKNPDMSMLAEIIFYLQADINTRDVDWLAWEDPFILSRDAAQLKQERENSLEETNKRLGYILPMIEILSRLSRNGRN